MLKRFEATIPFQRLVRVTWGAVRIQDEQRTDVGIAYGMRDQVIFLRLPERYIIIPKGLIINIEGYRMSREEPAKAPPIKSVLPAGWTMGQIEALPRAANALAVDDPKFDRFATAVLFEERVRITSNRPIDDPALAGSSLVENGITNVNEGHALQIDDYWVHIGELPPGETPATGLPRGRVVDIQFLGPREVPASEMV